MHLLGKVVYNDYTRCPKCATSTTTTKTTKTTTTTTKTTTIRLFRRKICFLETASTYSRSSNISTKAIISFNVLKMPPSIGLML